MKNRFFTLTGIACLAFSTMGTAQEKVPPVKKSPEQSAPQQDSVYYVCSMHPEVTAEKPGTCSQCGMPLEKKVIPRPQPKNPKMEGVKTYTCLTHPDVKSDKPGKCTKCGMDLVIDEKIK